MMVKLGLGAVAVVAASCASTGPTPNPSNGSSTSPPPSPPSSSNASFVLDLESGGETTQLFVFDPDGAVVAARKADGQETAATMERLAENDIVALRPGSDDVVVVGWLVTPCDRQASLTVAATAVTVELPPRPGCDALAIGRVVALQFADPARAALMRAQLIPPTIVPEDQPRTPVAPPPTGEG